MLKNVSPPRGCRIPKRSTLLNDETFLLVATTMKREQGQDSRLRNMISSSSGLKILLVIMGECLSAAVEVGEGASNRTE